VLYFIYLIICFSKKFVAKSFLIISYLLQNEREFRLLRAEIIYDDAESKALIDTIEKELAETQAQV